MVGVFLGQGCLNGQVGHEFANGIDANWLGHIPGQVINSK
jgi:hypothetical protein